MQKYQWLIKSLHAEAIAKDLFLNAAEALGITTPIDYEINQCVIDLILDARKVLNEHQKLDFDNIFPIKDHFRSITLAQHYGVSTRFLDWTESPLVACYFSAEKASSLYSGSNSAQNSSSHIVIYYFNIWPAKKSWPIEIIKAPRHENKNLLSQKGLFVNFKKANSYFVENKKWPDLYEYS